MKNIRNSILWILAAAMLLSLGAVIAASTPSAPRETNAFVDNYYIGETDQSSPFFDKVLPAIQKNIKTNNNHSITPYYDKFRPANNPENFQGLGSTTYANINGKTVTAEAFYRLRNESLHDPNNGMGLLVYQCIQYKRKHPDEDVKITFSSYRTSVTASVCVLPESKYYGYMRSLYGTNYDEHGFVRISYMLTEAARMGIEVTLVNQLPSYGVSQYNPETGKTKYRSHLNFDTYFTAALKTDCYDSYAPGKKVSDFMNYAKVGWRVEDKTGDMQHVKHASVSHYLATDGTEHRDTVFFASANLDENNYIGANGNNSSQSGVIISDHSDLWRVTYNYTQVMYKYRDMEEMFPMRKYINETNNEQIALILAGRENEIDPDEQIVYLGGKDDPVFELYFTPFGGSADSWDPVANPICKYVDKLAESDDYVEVIWNEFGYGSCNLGTTMSEKFEDAFCKNPNPDNKISLRVTDFDTEEIQKLELKSEIGYRSIKDGTNIHSKDILLSYEEDGVRHRVSLMTSCNFYMIAFNYRTNSMLVIHETDETGGDFYNIFGEKYSYGMIDNTMSISRSELEVGVGDSHKLTYAAEKKVTWSTSNPAVATVKNGVVKGVKAGTATIKATSGGKSDTVKVTVKACAACANADQGLTCSTDHQYVLSKKLDTQPLTMEAVFAVDKTALTGTTTIVGSDGTFDPALVFSLNKSGHPRIAIRSKADYSKQSVYIFNKVNVATNKRVHLSLVMDFSAKQLRCYVDGVLKQTIKNVSPVLPFEEKHNLVIGGDHRNGNATFFPGVIESVALWADARTSAEISADYKKGIDTGDRNLLAAYDLTRCDKCMVKSLGLYTNNLTRIDFWQDKEDVKDVGNYDYAFAVVGDTQTMCERDPEAMEALYDWILDNRESEKLEYVIGLGDITNKSADVEWERAEEYFEKLDGVIPYAVSRGNHDDPDDFNRVFSKDAYASSVDGTMTEGDFTNSYRTFNIQGTDYLILTLDFAPSTKVLKWVDSVIESHPDHRVIAVTHAYMYRDGTTIDDGDCYPPTHYEGYTDAQNGDDMWNKCFSKHKNVVLVLSGHDPWQHVVYRQDKGKNGNKVTQMLIDPQYVDLNNGSVGMVALFYFSNDGKTLTVRYYSVEKDCYGSPQSQFTINLY